MRVKWLRTALINLTDEAEYIAQENLKAAQELVTHVMASVSRLNMGHTGRVPGTRELVITSFPYIIPYRVKNGAVEILRVFHKARRWPRKL